MKTIPLTQDRVALVDDEDFERLSKYHWHYNKSGYALRVGYTSEGLRAKAISMASEVLCISALADHRNGDRLDNQKSNLRVCTIAQNCQNGIKTRNKTSSKYKGVYFWPRRKKWQAYINFLNIFGQSVRKHLGTFLLEEEAARVYDEAARKYHGEFATLNFAEKSERSCLG